MKLESEHDCLENDVLENMYRSKYQENLPENWFELLKVYSYFEVTKNSNNTSIYLVIMFYLTNYKYLLFLPLNYYRNIKIL